MEMLDSSLRFIGSYPVWAKLLILFGIAAVVVTLVFAPREGTIPAIHPSSPTTIGKVASERNLVDKAVLRLHTYGDFRIPDRLAMENIYRWYYLVNIQVTPRPDGEDRKIIGSTLFVSFDPDVRSTTLSVRSPDMKLPIYEVKDFNQRFAIVTFSGEVPAGTLEVSVSP